jgi:hypothetical protein
MAGPIYLFVSSSPDLAAEREALGQAVAELPISVGFEIMHTKPGETDDIDETLAFIERCDLYVIVLGGDFAAPMGLEWQRSQNTLRPTLAYAKRELHSPSAQKLLRESGMTWTPFDSPHTLKPHATQALAQMILERGERLGLHVEDVNSLLAVVGEKGQEPSEKPDLREGAGRGGIILGREE